MNKECDDEYGPTYEEPRPPALPPRPDRPISRRPHSLAYQEMAEHAVFWTQQRQHVREPSHTDDSWRSTDPSANADGYEVPRDDAIEEVHLDDWPSYPAPPPPAQRSDHQRLQRTGTLLEMVAGPSMTSPTVPSLRQLRKCKPSYKSTSSLLTAGENTSQLSFRDAADVMDLYSDEWPTYPAPPPPTSSQKRDVPKSVVPPFQQATTEKASQRSAKQPLSLSTQPSGLFQQDGSKVMSKSDYQLLWEAGKAPVKGTSGSSDRLMDERSPPLSPRRHNEKYLAASDAEYRPQLASSDANHLQHSLGKEDFPLQRSLPGKQEYLDVECIDFEQTSTSTPVSSQPFQKQASVLSTDYTEINYAATAALQGVREFREEQVASSGRRGDIGSTGLPGAKSTERNKGNRR